MSHLKKPTLKAENSSFYKNIGVLSIGIVVSQIIALGMSPALARLFNPENFSTLTAILAAGGIISSVSSLGYEIAIVLPEKEYNAKQLFWGSLALSFLACILLFIFVFFTPEKASTITGINEKFYLYLLIPIAYLSSAQRIISYFCNRKQLYKAMSLAKILQTLSFISISLILGKLHYSETGLIIASLISLSFFVLYILFILVKKHSYLFKNFHFSIAEWKKTAFKYKEFPIHHTPSALLGAIASHAHVFLFIALYSEVAAGIIFFAIRIVSGPLQLISNSFTHVYFQKLSTIKTKEKMLDFYSKNMLSLIFFSFFILILTWILPNQFFEWVFSSKWKGLAQYVKVLMLWISAQIVSSSLSSIFHVLKAQKYVSVFQGLNILTTALSIAIVHWMDGNVFEAVISFSISKFVIYSILTFIPLKLIKNSPSLI